MPLEHPESKAAETVWAVPNSSTQRTALTAASLLRRLTELVDELLTLHSSGILRPSQRPTTKSAFRPPSIETVIDNKLRPIKTDITELKSDMKVVKAAVTDLSGTVNDHDTRIKRLEETAAWDMGQDASPSGGGAGRISISSEDEAAEDAVYQPDFGAKRPEDRQEAARAQQANWSRRLSPSSPRISQLTTT